jgi:hypothetical protein
MLRRVIHKQKMCQSDLLGISNAWSAPTVHSRTGYVHAWTEMNPLPRLFLRRGFITGGKEHGKRTWKMELNRLGWMTVSTHPLTHRLVDKLFIRFYCIVIMYELTEGDNLICSDFEKGYVQ